MNVIFIHGENVSKSLGRLSRFEEVASKRGWEVVKINNGALVDSTNTGSLFGRERFFIVGEPFLIPKKDLLWFKKNHSKLKGNIVFFFEGNLPKDLKDALPKPDKVEEFSHPRIIFEFLESVFPGNSKKALRLFHRIILNDAPEYVFAAVSRHVRDLWWARNDYASLSYPSWRKGKLSQQSKKFPEGSLESLLKSLCEIDVNVKNSRADLVSSLDFLIGTKLE